MIIEALISGFTRCPCVRRGRHKVGHPATRMNIGVPQFASNIYNYLFIYIYIYKSILGGVYFPASKLTLFYKLALAPQKNGIYFGRISRNASIHEALRVAWKKSAPS